MAEDHDEEWSDEEFDGNKPNYLRQVLGAVLAVAIVAPLLWFQLHHDSPSDPTHGAPADNHGGTAITRPPAVSTPDSLAAKLDSAHREEAALISEKEQLERSTAHQASGDDLSKQIRAARKRLDAANSKVSEVQAQLAHGGRPVDRAKLNREMDALKQKRAALEQAPVSAGEDVAALKQEVKAREADLAAENESIKKYGEYGDNSPAFKQMLDNSKRQARAHRAEIAQLRRRISRASGAASHAMEKAKIDREVSAIARSLDAKPVDAAKLNEELKAAQSEQTQANKDLSALTAQQPSGAAAGGTGGGNAAQRLKEVNLKLASVRTEIQGLESMRKLSNAR
ncbi:MAG TPA: hypothetical protein VKT77_02185 [Chthonomonadaceae bacterium]|nr:hypothetical protein [Chthonomonadaceae bacterium]